VRTVHIAIVAGLVIGCTPLVANATSGAQDQQSESERRGEAAEAVGRDTVKGSVGGAIAGALAGGARAARRSAAPSAAQPVRLAGSPATPTAIATSRG
jgi:hypothetical protein